MFARQVPYLLNHASFLLWLFWRWGLAFVQASLDSDPPILGFLP
jgi:hypothetical protein